MRVGPRRGGWGAGPAGCAPGLGDGVGDGAVSGGSWAERVCGVELFCGCRALGCAGQCLQESKVPLKFTLLLGKRLWGPFLGVFPGLQNSLLVVKENLDLCPLLDGGGGGGVSLSFLEIRQLSLAVGQWAGGAGLATLPPTPVSLGCCEFVPKKPSIRGGLFTPPSLPPAVERGPQLFCGAWDFKLA